jgi:hypothetical protein
MAEQVSQRQEQTTIPDYARPYVEDLLGFTAALTDQEYNPYMQYMGERCSVLPVATQSYENAALMQTAPQLADASALAGQAGLGALNTSFTYNPYQARSFTDQTKNAAGRLCRNSTCLRTCRTWWTCSRSKPVVKMRSHNKHSKPKQPARARLVAHVTTSPALKAMRICSAIWPTSKPQVHRTLSSKACSSSTPSKVPIKQRLTLTRSKASSVRVLALQGLQTAFTVLTPWATWANSSTPRTWAQRSCKTNTACSNNSRVQNILSNQYQDFLNSQNYPYKQLGFMSDMLRGLPLTQQSATIYQPGPSTSNQLLGAATSLGGAYLMGGRKEGGMVSSYANGGAVNSRPAGLADLALSRMA